MLEQARARAVEVLRRHGLRCAGPRIEVLAHMIEAHRPLSAQELIEALEADDVNEATVYRTLNTLTEAGISTPVELQGRKRLYEVHLERQCRDVHAHFVCRCCGGVRCLEALDQGLVKPPSLEDGYHVERQELYLYGSCPKCHEVQP